jgi:plasmid stabilization system protein ParE
MSYTVVVTEPAEEELLAAYQWWATHRSAEQAGRWYNGILDAIGTLAENPERCPIAREDGKFPVELRELHFGLGTRPSHRAIFTIRPDVVLVYTIRHVAQDDWQPDS